MTFISLVICFGALVVSAALTGVIRRHALRRGLLDVPNRRSSHSVATPRGGGAAIVCAVIAADSALVLLGHMDVPLFVAMLGGIPVACVGYLDDRRGVAPSVRLLVHFGAAGWALAWLGGLPPIQVGSHTYLFGAFGYVLGAIGIVWTLNLFNFMDGIDGIAGSEAAFVALAGTMLATLPAGGSDAVAAAVLGTSCIGFLVWNWPPARIFMGDVGSGYVGFMIAVLALGFGRHDTVGLFVWVILGGVFFVDATVTFCRRLLRGEAVQVAHRSHAYQWLSRAWASHLRVTLLVILVNVIWILPLAYAALRAPQYAGWITLVALVPLAAGALWLNAGRAE
jgi:Fuc2NAc and GlcNAc transferase